MALALVPTISHAGNSLPAAITQPVSSGQLIEYSTDTPAVQTLILKAATLSKMNLTYLYGSANPKNKGMDCSGTIYYLLTQSKLDNVPRQSDQLYNWLLQNGKLHKVTKQSFYSPEFTKLKPGDLLFWSGTYNTHRESAISHVMMYLGKNKQGQRLMFGASDGRTYAGKKMWGVSVFDFYLPDQNDAARFVGYGCIPGLTCDN